MHRLTLLSLAFPFITGCSPQRAPDVDSAPLNEVRTTSTAADLDRAQNALLELMRQDRSPFEGADPVEFAKLAAQQTGPREFAWGAFTLNLERRRYSATVQIGDCTHFYDGQFDVAADGRWTARPTTVAIGTDPPPGQ